MIKERSLRVETLKFIQKESAELTRGRNNDAENHRHLMKRFLKIHALERASADVVVGYGSGKAGYCRTGKLNCRFVEVVLMVPKMASRACNHTFPCSDCRG